MPNLVLMRHGESYTNAERYIATDNQNLLTQRGVRHTLDNARAFRTVREDFHFDTVFVSPLPRTIQTAYTFLSGFGNKPVDITLAPELVERKFDFECFRTFAEMRQEFGDETVTSWELDINARPGEKGESLSEVYERAVTYYNEAITPKVRSGKKVLVVSHYYVLKCLQSYLNYGGIDMVPVYHPSNSALIPLRVGKDGLPL